MNRRCKRQRPSNSSASSPSACPFLSAGGASRHSFVTWNRSTPTGQKPHHAACGHEPPPRKKNVAEVGVGIMVMGSPLDVGASTSRAGLALPAWAGMCTAGSRPCQHFSFAQQPTCDEVGHLVVSWQPHPFTGLFWPSRGGCRRSDASTLCVVRRHRRWRGCKRGGLCIRNGLHAAPFPRSPASWFSMARNAATVG